MTETLVTVVDVARLAGVSTATAARALGGYGSVRRSTQERVEAAAATLGYRPNALAKSMITGRTLTLGTVIADIENPFFSRVIRGIADVAKESGFEVILVNSDEDVVSEQAAVRVLLDKRVDGMLVAPASRSTSAHLVDAIRSGTPVVLIDRDVEGLDTDSVQLRNIDAAADAVARLVSAGHTRIGYVSGALREHGEGNTISTGGERIAGYLAGLRDAGLPSDDTFVRIGGPRRADAAHQTELLLDLDERPTAIIGADSVITLGILEAIRARGLRIPTDISVVGFDDAEWTTVVQPPLSVISQPAYELGADAARLLIERVHGRADAFESVRLDSLFVERESVAAPSEPTTSIRSQK